ncbi:MAG: hypothetical protein KatS3mg057_2713 [Herpetosiphonaceae bacterium]|nr:MAG: hypothetical protein KatS3mg057_2713 [Herpetosiphonaceae bacterium]
MAAPLSSAQRSTVEISTRPAALTWRAAWAITVTLTLVLAAVAATWPLALYLPNTLPIGTEREATVPLFNLWTLWWNADRAATGFAGYWDAPFFFPNRGVLSYSEPLTLPGLLSTPLWVAGAAPALVYNLVLLTLLVLNGLFAYRLARALDIARLPSLLSAILTIALPFTVKILGVLPIVGLFGLLWSLEGLVRFGREGSLRWAVWFATGLLALYLTSQQFTLIAAPFLAIAAVVTLRQRAFSRRSVAALLVAGLVAGVCILLLALPAMNIHQELGFRRSDSVVAALSARPIDLLTRSDTALLGFPPRTTADTGGLFPGFLLVLLAASGAFAGLRGDPAGQRLWVLYLLGSILLALLLALGLNLSILGWQPFDTLRALVPGFDRLRSPFRFASVMQLYLPCLAAFAFGFLQQRVLRASSVLIVLLAILAMLENLAVPTPLAAAPESPQTAWSAWLREQPEGTVIAHVPFPQGLNVADYEIESWRLFAQIDHRKPMVNGYSGYFPQAIAPDGSIIPTYTHFQLAMAELFPDYRLACVLDQGLGVDLLVVDTDWFAAVQERFAQLKSFLQPVYSDDQVQIFSLQAPAGECRTQ